MAWDLIDESKMTQTELQELCLKHAIAFHKFGPATVHEEIIQSTFRNCPVELPEYISTLKGDALKQYVAAICTPMKKKEQTDLQECYHRFQDEIDNICRSDIQKEQLQDKEILTVMTDFAVHLYLDYGHLDEEICKEMAKAARDIFDFCEKAWKETVDVPLIKAYFQKYREFIQKPGFPQNEQVGSNADNFIRRIRDITGKKIVYLEKVGPDVLETLLCLSQCQYQSKDEKMILDIFGTMLYFFRDPNDEDYKNKIEIFLSIMPPFKKVLASIDAKFLYQTRFASDIMGVLEKSFGKNKKYIKEWLSLAVALFKRPCYRTMLESRDVLGLDDIYKWKDHKEIANEVFDAITMIQIPKDDEKLTDFCSQLKSAINSFLNGLKKSRILKDYGEGLMYLSLNLLEMKEVDLFEVAEEVAENVEINVQAKKDSVMEVIKRLHTFVKDEDLPWHTEWVLQRAVEDLLESLLDKVHEGKIFSNDDMRVFVAMCYTCLQHDGINPEDASLSAHILFALKIMNKLMGWLGMTKRMGLAVGLIPPLFKFYDEDDENLCLITSRMFSDFAQHEPATLIPYLDRLLVIYLEKDDENILRPINQIYQVNPAPLKKHFQELISQFLERGEPEVTSSLGQLFYNASRKQPEVKTFVKTETFLDMTSGHFTEKNNGILPPYKWPVY